MGATAGRTTLNGEGLQHEDGHSHLVALTVPTCRAYDPAFGYEVATIVEEGINRMFVKGEDLFYYLTIYNESYDMPAMPQGVRDGILKGLYPFKTVKPDGAKHTVQLLGSGVILREVLAGPGDPGDEVPGGEHGLQRHELPGTAPRRDRVRARSTACTRTGRSKCPYVQQVLGTDANVPVIASSDYMRARAGAGGPVPEQPAAGPGHGRLRPVGDAAEPAAVLRGGRRARDGGDAARPGRARPARPRGREAGDPGPGH